MAYIVDTLTTVQKKLFLIFLGVFFIFAGLFVVYTKTLYALSACPSLGALPLSIGTQDSFGDSSVQSLQFFLANYFNIQTGSLVTGYFGIETERYVKLFQSQNGLSQVGIVGPETRTAIARSCGGYEGSIAGGVTSAWNLTQGNAAGVLTASGCATSAAPGATCGVRTSWTTQHSYFANNTALSSVEVWDAATNQIVGGKSIAGVNQYRNVGTESGSYTFSLSAGAYIVVLYGWSGGGYVVLDKKNVAVGVGYYSATQGVGGYSVVPNVVRSPASEGQGVIPQGTLNVVPCSVMPQGMCALQASWVTSNSFYRPGVAFGNVSLLNAATNQYAGSAQPTVGVNYAQSMGTPNGSYAFRVGAGTYKVVLSGWSLGAYVVLDSQIVTIGSATATSALQPLPLPPTLGIGTSTQRIPVPTNALLPNITIPQQPLNTGVMPLPPLSTIRFPSVATPTSPAVPTQVTNSTPTTGIVPTSQATTTVTQPSVAVNPSGTVTATGCTTQAAGGNCNVAVSWTTSNSFLVPGIPLGTVNVIDNATGNFVGGSPVSGISYYQDTTRANSSYTFSLKRGEYSFVLYGWQNNAYVFLAQRTVRVSDPSTTGSSGSTQTGSNTQTTTTTQTQTTTQTAAVAPTGSLSASGCTTSVAGGTCGVSSSWSTQNSFYSPNVPFSVVNVIDNGSGTFVGGSAVEGVSYHQDLTRANSSYTFNLSAGSYTLVLYGWSNDAYVLLDQKGVTVANGQSASLIGGSGATLNSLLKTLQRMTALFSH